MSLYIGIMSGTSFDGLDTILADFSTPLPQVLGRLHQAYPEALRTAFFHLSQTQYIDLDECFALDRQLALLYAQTVKTLLLETGHSASAISAIGSHGQTLRHRPQAEHPYTLQLVDPNIIATETGIPTVADFRRKDLALGGQGAPLAPLFHEAVFAQPEQGRVVLNVGGMANISVLRPGQPVLGFDTGPGNVLLDAWIQMHKASPYDENGAWASQGKVDSKLLDTLLSDSFFRRSPPKSCGRDDFNLSCLLAQLSGQTPVDVQATLLALSVASIAQAILPYEGIDDVIVCGGGAKNPVFLQALAQALPQQTLHTSDHLGLASQDIEALLMAWLAKQHIEGKALDTRSVTGSRKPVILGGLYPP